jgi:hypothetical protein
LGEPVLRALAAPPRAGRLEDIEHNDIAHGYGDQHTSWSNGAMDRWAQAHAGDGDHTFPGYYGPTRTTGATAWRAEPVWRHLTAARD